MSLPPDLDEKKKRAFEWFMQLRDRIAEALDQIEAELPSHLPFADRPPGRLIKRLWQRKDHTASTAAAG